MGMTTAIVNRNPVVSHCAVVAVMFRSTIRVGSATLMIVSLRIMTNAAMTRMPIRSLLPGASSSSGADSDMWSV